MTTSTPGARELRESLNELVPVPTVADGVTAGGVIRWLSAQVMVNMSRFGAELNAGPPSPVLGTLSTLMCAEYAAAALLVRVRAHDEKGADALAETIVSVWEMGETEEFAAEFLGDALAEQVHALAEQIAAAERAEATA